ncbi:hypothetical protein J7337_013453 [Fusarium musae]|uniref:PD-(D/E)XK nuclease-like domain-containing protein n=1 Tax=Fusarium musae TaxID=1042133 RepID=A0A9P8IJ93_9HYPO|nr:hypothetical protein J7337_013453 [Fusarium musae]KAG9495218.1 hypothetical protein J7337_013453 [Fusarium musae]
MLELCPQSETPILVAEYKWTCQLILSNIVFSDDRDKLGHKPVPEAIHTTASNIAEYHVTSASKKADFCMYLDPMQDDFAQVSDTIDAPKNIFPLGIFNRTNLAPLSDSPIAVGIEIKKTGERWENAKLQMEVWMAAHWQFLWQLLLRKRAQELATSDEMRWSLPDFITGIIIQRHDWHLIITTPEGDKTLFWQKKNLGDTSNSMGIYKIIYNLELLRQWAQEEYYR